MSFITCLNGMNVQIHEHKYFYLKLAQVPFNEYKIILQYFSFISATTKKKEKKLTKRNVKNEHYRIIRCFFRQ